MDTVSLTFADGTALDDFKAQVEADIAALKTTTAGQIAQEAKNAAAIAVAQTAVTALQSAVSALQAGTPSGSGTPPATTSATFGIVTAPPASLTIGDKSPSVNVSISPSLPAGATANFYWSTAKPTAQPTSSPMAGAIFNNQGNIAIYPAIPAAAGTYYLSVWTSTGASFVFPAVAVAAAAGTAPPATTPPATTPPASSWTPDYGITNGSLGSTQIWLHGSYPPAGQEGLPSRIDLSLDDGASWPYINCAGFAHDNGAWDTWVTLPNIGPGTYKVAIRNNAAPNEVVTAPSSISFVINPNTAPASVTFNPIKFSTSLPNGSSIGLITASGGTPQQTLVLTTSSLPPGLAISQASGNTWLVTVSDNTKLVAGAATLAGKVCSGSLCQTFSASFPISQGVIVDPSKMVFSQAAGLSNASPVGSPAFTVAMNGYTGGAYSILAQSAPGNDATGCKPRYTLAANTGTTSNTCSAQTEPLTIVWTDGINTCVAPQSITIPDVRGTGATHALTDQATLTSIMTAAEADPLGAYKGAVFIVSPGTYTAGWPMPGASDGWDDNSFFGPATFEGKPGVLPLMTLGTPNPINNGKGWLEQYGWDATIKGLEFANLYESNPGEVGNFSGIKLNAGVLGRLDVQYLYIRNCTNAIMGGETGQIVTIKNSEFAKCGGGDGFTHNFYINVAKYAEIDTVVSWGANVGHNGKIRAEKSLVTNSVFADGPTGCASYLLDFPDGGDHTVIGGISEKGEYAQNSPMIRYGEEDTHPHPVNQLTVKNHTFINRNDGTFKLPNGDTIWTCGIQVRAPGGKPITVTLSGNKFYGISKDRAMISDSGSLVTFVDDGTNEYDLPLSSAPAQSSYISLSGTDANVVNHPWQAGGYTSGSTPGPYLQGPMTGK